MIIELLLNNNIQIFFGQMILHFQKEMNVIVYIIEIVFKINFNCFIWTKCQ
jgi:hypothetical protein